MFVTYTVFTWATSTTMVKVKFKFKFNLRCWLKFTDNIWPKLKENFFFYKMGLIYKGKWN